MTHHYLYVDGQSGERKSRDDLLITFPSKITSDHEWECAITELALTLDSVPQSKRLYLCCDLLEESFVDYKQLPVLRNIEVISEYKNIEFLHLRYLKLRPGAPNDFRLYFLDQYLRPVRFDWEDFYCTIHFRKRWGR